MEDSQVKKLERRIQFLEKKIEKIKKWIWLKFEDEIPDELLQDEVDNDGDKSIEIVQIQSSRPRVTRIRTSQGDTDDDLEIISEIPPSSYDNNLIQIDDDDSQDDGEIQIIENDQEEHQTQIDPVIVSTETICDPLALELHNNHHSTYQNQQDQKNLYISGEARIIDTATLIRNNHQKFTNHNHDPNVNDVNNDEEMYNDNVDPLSIDLPIASRVLPQSNPLPDIHQTNEIFTTTQNLIDNIIEQTIPPIFEPEPAEPQDLNLVVVKNEDWVQHNFQLEDTYYQEGECDYENIENNDLDQDQDQNDYEYNENQNEYYQEEEDIDDSGTNLQEYLDVNYVPSSTSGKTNAEKYNNDNSGNKGPTRRTRFTQRQLGALRKSYKSQMYPGHEEYLRLSHELNLSTQIVRYWFNRQRRYPTSSPSTKDIVKRFIKNRLSYSEDQLKILRDYLNKGKTTLTPTEAEEISQKTGLPKFSVYRWFNNKRSVMRRSSKRSTTTTNSNITNVNVNETVDTITLNYLSEDSESDSGINHEKSSAIEEAHSSTSTENPHRKRSHTRKTESQLAILRKYFYEDGIKQLDLRSKKIETISRETNLSVSVVFNWFMNTKRKEDNLQISNSMTINSDSGIVSGANTYKSTQKTQDNDYNDDNYYFNDDNNDDDNDNSSSVGGDDHGTRTRTKFTDLQIQILKKHFEENKRLDSTRAGDIAGETGLSSKTIRKWFSNKNYAILQNKGKDQDISINSVYSVDSHENSNSSSTSNTQNQSQLYNYNYNKINNGMPNLCDDLDSIRKKRTIFTESQLSILRKYFYDEGVKYVSVSSDMMKTICSETGLDGLAVHNWFNNYRLRLDKERTEMDQHQVCDGLSDNSKKRSRTKFTKEQLDTLWSYYNKDSNIDDGKSGKISLETGLSPIVIMNWFKNRNYLIAKGAEVHPGGQESSKSASVSVENLTEPSASASSTNENDSTWYTSSSNFDDFNDSQAKRRKTVFTENQVKILWGYYDEDQKNFDISNETIEKASLEINIPQKIVMNWFKNKNYQIQKGTVVYPGQQRTTSTSRTVSDDSRKTNSIFTATQIAFLVAKFKRNPRPDTFEYEDIAEELGPHFKTQSIKNWFQNQRTGKKKSSGSASTSTRSSIGRRQSQNENETEGEVEIIENTTSTSTVNDAGPGPENETDTTDTKNQDLSDSHQDSNTEVGNNEVSESEKVENAFKLIVSKVKMT